MTKTKVLKILPYWLVFLVCLTAIQSASLILVRGKKSVIPSPEIEAAGQPQVLGASTSIRGDAPAQVSLIQQVKEPDLSQVSAKSFLVFDLVTGQELVKKNPDQHLAIASLTKLMTALVAYKQSDLNQIFRLTAEDKFNIKPVLGLAPDDTVQALDVFNAMLIGSCNDAARALANYVARSTDKNFTELMNQQAKDLGMSDSRFSNPMGFDSTYNYSTADNLKTLITETQKLAVFTNLGRRSSYEFVGSSGKTYSTTATNKLLASHPELQAIKTGFTETAGGAMATKFTISGHDLIILVLDSKNREADTLILKNEVANDFDFGQQQ